MKTETIYTANDDDLVEYMEVSGNHGWEHSYLIFFRRYGQALHDHKLLLRVMPEEIRRLRQALEAREAELVDNGSLPEDAPCP